MRYLLIILLLFSCTPDPESIEQIDPNNLGPHEPRLDTLGPPDDPAPDPDSTWYYNAGPQEPPIVWDNENILEWRVKEVKKVSCAGAIVGLPWDRIDTLLIYAQATREKALLNFKDSTYVEDPGCEFIPWYGFDCLYEYYYSGQLYPCEIADIEEQLNGYLDGLKR